MTHPAGKATRQDGLSTTLATRSNDVLLQQVHQDRLQRRERAEQLAAIEELMEDNHTLQMAILSYYRQRHIGPNAGGAVHGSSCVGTLHRQNDERTASVGWM
jgi:hypothetical protein